MSILFFTMLFIWKSLGFNFTWFYQKRCLQLILPSARVSRFLDFVSQKCPTFYNKFKNLLMWNTHYCKPFLVFITYIYYIQYLEEISETLRKVSVLITFDQSRPVSVSTTFKFLSLEESQSRQPWHFIVSEPGPNNTDILQSQKISVLTTLSLE